MKLEVDLVVNKEEEIASEIFKEKFLIHISRLGRESGTEGKEYELMMICRML